MSSSTPVAWLDCSASRTPARSASDLFWLALNLPTTSRIVDFEANDRPQLRLHVRLRRVVDGPGIGCPRS